MRCPAHSRPASLGGLAAAASAPLLLLAVAAAAAAALAAGQDADCAAANGTAGLNYLGGDLSSSGTETTAAACALACRANALCVAFVFHRGGCSGHGESKARRCYLKSKEGCRAPNPCNCAGVVRGPQPSPHPCPAPVPRPRPPPPGPPSQAACPTRKPAKAPAGAKNVLYVLVDDLRPSLSPYGQTQVHTPNIQKLADTGTLFERAYCQEAVCSPSRNSFLSGRGPDNTRAGCTTSSTISGRPTRASSSRGSRSSATPSPAPRP